MKKFEIYVVLSHIFKSILNISGAALGISINGFTSPQESYCTLNFKWFPNPGSRNPRVHQQWFWKSTGSQEPQEPVLTQPLFYS